MRRTIKTLIYKNYLVSKRQWKTTVFVEILLPMFLIWLACEINSSFYKHLTSRSTPDHDFEFGEVLDYGDVASLEKNDSSVPNLEKTRLRDLNVAFSPSNNSTKTLMKHFKDCARIDNGESELKYLPSFLFSNARTAVARRGRRTSVTEKYQFFSFFAVDCRVRRRIERVILHFPSQGK